MWKQLQFLHVHLVQGSNSFDDLRCLRAYYHPLNRIALDSFVDAGKHLIRAPGIIVPCNTLPLLAEIGG